MKEYKRKRKSSRKRKEHGTKQEVRKVPCTPCIPCTPNEELKKKYEKFDIFSSFVNSGFEAMMAWILRIRPKT